MSMQGLYEASSKSDLTDKKLENLSIEIKQEVERIHDKFLELKVDLNQIIEKDIVPRIGENKALIESNNEQISGILKNSKLQQVTLQK